MRALGYRAPAVEHRGTSLNLALPERLNLPRRVDLRPHAPPVRDQGPLGSCTGHAFAYAMHALMLRHQRGGGRLDVYEPSPLWIYARERMLTGGLQADEGATLVEGVAVLTTLGVAREADWPYDLTRWNHPPPHEVNTRALRLRLSVFDGLTRDLNDVRWCLAGGWPVVVGVTLYRSFEDVNHRGTIPLPREGEARLGGHAMALVGYDDEKLCFLVRNSWGAAWGAQGYGWLPYEYVQLASLCHEVYALRALAGALTEVPDGSA